MVVILVSTLSLVGVGLFANRSAFSPLLATQQLSSATLLAQQAALAGNPSSTLTIQQSADELIFLVGASDFRIARNGATLSYRVAGNPFATVPAGGLEVGFNQFGRVAAPVARANIDFRITGDSTLNLCLSSLGAVYAEACP